MGVLTQAAQEGFNFQSKINIKDLTEAAADTAQAIDIAVIPADAVVEKVAYYLESEFSGGSATALTVEIGDNDDPDGFVTAKSILSGATPISSGYNDGAYTTSNTLNGKHYVAVSNKQVKATITPTGDSLANLESGVIIVKAKVLDLSKDL